MARAPHQHCLERLVSPPRDFFNVTSYSQPCNISAMSVLSVVAAAISSITCLQFVFGSYFVPQLVMGNATTESLEL
eukprot:2671614-Amphidinium_carterae.1